MSQPDDVDFESDLFAVTEQKESECQISGCDRMGVIPRNVRGDGPEEPVAKHYVCRYHHRLFLSIKIGLAISLALLFLIAFFNV